MDNLNPIETLMKDNDLIPFILFGKMLEKDTKNILESLGISYGFSTNEEATEFQINILEDDTAIKRFNDFILETRKKLAKQAENHDF